MGEGWTGKRALSARRWVVSAFVAAHIGATVLWVMPPCPLRTQSLGAVQYYILPLGLWQYWGMFSPDPPLHVLTLQAEAIDAHGLRYNFAFPKQTDYTVWTAIPRHRHPKFAMNLADDVPGITTNRVFAARHVVRQLGLTTEAFPVDVRLNFQVAPCPTPGGSPGEPSAPTRTVSIGTFRFANLGEVRP